MSAVWFWVGCDCVTVWFLTQVSVSRVIECKWVTNDSNGRDSQRRGRLERIQFETGENLLCAGHTRVYIGSGVFQSTRIKSVSDFSWLLMKLFTSISKIIAGCVIHVSKQNPLGKIIFSHIVKIIFCANAKLFLRRFVFCYDKIISWIKLFYFLSTLETINMNSDPTWWKVAFYSLMSLCNPFCFRPRVSQRWRIQRQTETIIHNLVNVAKT